MQEGAPILTEGDVVLLRSFGLTRAQKREVWAAWLESPEGVERCAFQARSYAKREGSTGAGLLLTMIRRGDHLAEHDPSARRVTGWRFVRGSHSGTYVPDKQGTDPLPAGYGVEG